MSKYQRAKKKKTGWIWFFCLLLLLVGSGVAVFYLKPEWVQSLAFWEQKTVQTAPKKVEKKKQEKKEEKIEEVRQRFQKAGADAVILHMGELLKLL